MNEFAEREIQLGPENKKGEKDHGEEPPSTPVDAILVHARAQLSRQKPCIKEINGSKKNAENSASRKALMDLDLQKNVGIFFNITSDPRKSLKLLIQLSRIADAEELILRHSKKGDSIGVCLLKDPTITYTKPLDEETIKYLSRFALTII